MLKFDHAISKNCDRKFVKQLTSIFPHYETLHHTRESQFLALLISKSSANIKRQSLFSLKSCLL